MLIFSQFTSYLDLIAQRLRADGVEYDMITGATPKKRRLELVDRFNADATPVFLISLKAGNTGLNLTGACVVVHADPWWNAAAQDQATDRAHRIGQTQDVNVYQIVARSASSTSSAARQTSRNGSWIPRPPPPDGRWPRSPRTTCSPCWAEGFSPRNSQFVAIPSVLGCS